MTLSADRLDALDAFLIELNRAAAGAILPLFRADHGLDDKGSAKGQAFDPVTEADRGAEAAIRALISEHFPDHGVIGEEYGEDRPNAEFVWVLDPVDGTRAFVAGLPLWTTLIALRHEGRPVLSSIGQSFIGELYIGHAGGSRLMARGRSERLAVRPCPDLSKAIIATTDADGCFNEAERAAWLNLRAASRLARFGCDAYAFAMVAAGTMDLVVEAGLQTWDVEAAIPLLEGAGGGVTDWTGKPIGRHGGQMALAGDPACLEAALEYLRPAASK